MKLTIDLAFNKDTRRWQADLEDEQGSVIGEGFSFFPSGAIAEAVENAAIDAAEDDA